MRKKISSLRLSTLSSGLILFAFFFLIQQFWEMVVSDFALLPSLAFIQILLMILSTFLELQAVILYMIGAFFGGILWEYLAQRLATDLLAKEHEPR